MGVCGSSNFSGVGPTRIVNFGKLYILGDNTSMNLDTNLIYSKEEDLYWLKMFNLKKMEMNKDWFSGKAIP